jgi:hypothetical protein
MEWKPLTAAGVRATKLGHESVASLCASDPQRLRMHKLGMPGRIDSPSKIQPFPSSLLK